MALRLEPNEDSDTHGSIVIKSLLSDFSTKSETSSSRSRPLISEINSPSITSDRSDVDKTSKPFVSGIADEASDGPSLLELMMEAQKSATIEKKQTQEEQQSNDAKSGFGGFKKGFFGAKSSTKESKVTNQKTITKPQPVIATVTRNKEDKTDKLVIPDVQKAMEEDNALMKQLRGNEWVTQDLMSAMSQNAVLSAGFRDPKCLAAMELMRKNPTEAISRFQSDPDVSRFLQEFGKVMSVHFTSLGEQQQSSSSTLSTGSNPNIAPAAKIAEVGPLQSQAISKQKKSSTTLQSNPVSPPNPPAEEEKVQQVCAILQ